MKAKFLVEAMDYEKMYDAPFAYKVPLINVMPVKALEPIQTVLGPLIQEFLLGFMEEDLLQRFFYTPLPMR